MSTWKTVPAAALAVSAILAAAPALAADYCVQSAGETFVLKNAKFPKAGGCTVVQGFCKTCGQATALFGSLCGSTNGNHARGIILTMHESGPTLSAILVVINRQTQTGLLDELSMDDGDDNESNVDVAVAGGPCGVNEPVP